MRTTKLNRVTGLNERLWGHETSGGFDCSSKCFLNLNIYFHGNGHFSRWGQLMVLSLCLLDSINLFNKRSQYSPSGLIPALLQYIFLMSRLITNEIEDPTSKHTLYHSSRDRTFLSKALFCQFVIFKRRIVARQLSKQE